LGLTEFIQVLGVKIWPSIIN